MSKRKRKKPKRKARASPRVASRHDLGFTRSVAAIRAHLTSVTALDAYLALLIGDLWLPNISAQARQTLAFTVFASEKPDSFGEACLATYDQFSAFLSGLYSLLPTFPMLDDYIPERDWGQIRVAVDDKSYRMMYGGGYERLPDYIQAFMLSRNGNVAERNDLVAVLAMQDQLMATIAQSIDTDQLKPGHLEVPSHTFWSQAQAALAQSAMFFNALTISPELIAHPGTVARPDAASFGDKFMAGKLVPAALVELRGQRWPLLPRSACGAVIEYWQERDSRPAAQVERQTAVQTADFLAQRLRPSDLLPGAIRVPLRHSKFGDLYAAGLFKTASTLWIVAPIDIRRAEELTTANRRLHQLIAEHEGLIAQDLASGKTMHLSLKGSQASGVRVLAVLVAPIAGAAVRVTRSPAYSTLFLTDLVSIIESIDRVDELERFFAFVDTNKQAASPFISAIDLFAAYRDSHGVLLGGATVPTMIMLDPHGGSNFRFTQLRDFWAAAPRRFPDDEPTTWRVAPTDGSLHQLQHRSRWRLSWCTDGVDRTLHFILDADEQQLDERHGRLLEVFIQCLADAWNERAQLFPGELLSSERIVTYCRANLDRLPPERASEPSNEPLFTAWRLVSQDVRTLVLEVEVDLTEVAAHLTDATDARFEAFCAGEWLRGVCDFVGVRLGEDSLRGLAASADRKPRFTLSYVKRIVDIPENPDPIEPDPEHFKLARRDLALAFHAEDIAPGRYELQAAKTVIDTIRDRYRSLVHQRISQFDQAALVRMAVEQLDHLIGKYDRENQRLKLSLSHEVEFDRTRRQAKVHRDFVQATRNVRYLVEVTYSQCVAGGVAVGVVPDTEDWKFLLAQVDWLLVLYGASDTLHNGLAVGGVEVDHDFIPYVFYEQGEDSDYQQEVASELLEGDHAHDRVAAMSQAQREELDAAFVASVGFSSWNLLQVLAVLGHWMDANDGAIVLAWSYQAPKAKVLDLLADHLHEVPRAQLEAALGFLTLDPRRVRLLAGREVEEKDVPIWEHRKRVHRYTIRPLLQVGPDQLLWGAAAVHRAFGIWEGTFSDGYPPADLGYPEIDAVAASIKQRIEHDLELRAVDVFRRHLTYVEHGIDFRSRFPRERFPEIGDFDVLAYQPQGNRWFMVECKYNKPPFCLKDTRRLQDEVFGKSSASGQVGKIARRQAFLSQHWALIAKLLGWPIETSEAPQIEELYVCPRIFPFMRRPPRKVLTQFVRLGKLDAFLREKLGEPAAPGELAQ